MNILEDLLSIHFTCRHVKLAQHISSAVMNHFVKGESKENKDKLRLALKDEIERVIDGSRRKPTPTNVVTMRFDHFLFTRLNARAVAEELSLNSLITRELIKSSFLSENSSVSEHVSASVSDSVSHDVSNV